MSRRWAEARLYRKTMQLAVAALRRAARTPNALEKLEALEVAEQKLLDARWLNPEADHERFDAGIAEIHRSRKQTLGQAIPASERLLEVAGEGLGDAAELLTTAGRLLSFLNHYLPEDPRVEPLHARFLELGGEQQAYTPVPPLSQIYHRPAAGVGCGSLICLLLAVLALVARSGSTERALPSGPGGGHHHGVRSKSTQANSSAVPTASRALSGPVQLGLGNSATKPASGRSGGSLGHRTM